jgi:predicted nicotinamide N-methyase
VKQYNNRQVRRTLRKYDLVPYEVLVGNKSLIFDGVRDAYALLDRMVAQEEKRVRAERFPYWAEIWPASIGLARWIDQVEGAENWDDALEFGCGLGLAGITLARRGGRVIATDFVEDALVLAQHNARKNGAMDRHRTAYLDWRHPVGDRVDHILASDVAYEKKNHSYLLRSIEMLLNPGGYFYLSDPRRPMCRLLVDMLINRGYQHRQEQIRVSWKKLEHSIDIHCLRRPGITG